MPGAYRGGWGGMGGPAPAGSKGVATFGTPPLEQESPEKQAERLANMWNDIRGYRVPAGTSMWYTGREPTPTLGGMWNWQEWAASPYAGAPIQYQPYLGPVPTPTPSVTQYTNPVVQSYRNHYFDVAAKKDWRAWTPEDAVSYGITASSDKTGSMKWAGNAEWGSDSPEYKSLKQKAPYLAEDLDKFQDLKYNPVITGVAPKGIVTLDIELTPETEGTKTLGGQWYLDTNSGDLVKSSTSPYGRKAQNKEFGEKAEEKKGTFDVITRDDLNKQWIGSNAQSQRDTNNKLFGTPFTDSDFTQLLGADFPMRKSIAIAFDRVSRGELNLEDIIDEEKNPPEQRLISKDFYTALTTPLTYEPPVVLNKLESDIISGIKKDITDRYPDLASEITEPSAEVTDFVRGLLSYGAEPTAFNLLGTNVNIYTFHPFSELLQLPSRLAMQFLTRDSWSPDYREAAERNWAAFAEKFQKTGKLDWNEWSLLKNYAAMDRAYEKNVPQIARTFGELASDFLMWMTVPGLAAGKASTDTSALTVKLAQAEGRVGLWNDIITNLTAKGVKPTKQATAFMQQEMKNVEGIQNIITQLRSEKYQNLIRTTRKELMETFYTLEMKKGVVQNLLKKGKDVPQDLIKDITGLRMKSVDVAGQLRTQRTNLQAFVENLNMPKGAGVTPSVTKGVPKTALSDVGQLYQFQLKQIENKQEIFDILKARGTDSFGVGGDERFRSMFSTGTRFPLKSGETWESRAIKYIDSLKANAERTAQQIPTPEVTRGAGALPKVTTVTTVPPYSEIEKVSWFADWMRKASYQLNKIPVMKRLMHVGNQTTRVGEIPTKENRIAKGSIIFYMGRQMSKELADVDTTDIVGLNKLLGVNLSHGEKYGLAKNLVGRLTGKSPNAMEAMQKPQLYTFRDKMLATVYPTLEKHPLYKSAQSVRNLGEGLIKEQGLDINLLKMEYGQQWWHRMLQKGAELPTPGVGKKFSIRPEQMSRHFQDIEEGIKAGIPYDADIELALRTHYRTLHELVNEKNFFEYIKDLGTDAFDDVFTSEIKRTNQTVNYYKSLQIPKDVSKMSKTTINAIARRSPELADKISSGISKEDLNNSVRTEAQKVYNYLSDLKARKDIQDKMVDIKGIPAFEGWKFPEVMAKELKDVLRGKPIDPYTNAITQFNNVARMMKAGMDLGAGFIHGQILLFYRPDLWARANYNSLKAMVNPEFIKDFSITHRSSIKEMIISGRMSLNSSEFVEAAGLLGKIPVIGAIPKAFERQFNVFLDTSRVYLWEGLRMPGMTGKQLADVGSVIDNMMGTLNSTRLGLSSRQKAYEAVALFSARYRRSGVALMLNTINGGVRSSVALRALGSYLAGGTVALYALNTALGNKTELDPTKSDFATVKIGDTKIRMGGYMMGTLRFVTNVYQAATKNPERLLSLDPRDNPFLKTWRSIMSPFMGLATSAITQRTYLGESFNLWNMPRDLFLPFALDPLIEGLDNSMPRATFEMGGLVTWSETYSAKLRELKDDIAQKQYKMDFNELEQKDKLASRKIEDMPEVAKLRSMAASEIMRRDVGGWTASAELEKQFNNWSGEFDTIRRSRAVQLLDAESQYKRTGNYDWYTQRLKDISSKHYEVTKDLRKEYPLVYEYLSNPRDAKEGESSTTRAYYALTNDVFNNPELEGLSADAYWQKLDGLKKDYIKTWGQGNYDYAFETMLTGSEFPSIYKARKGNLDEIGRSGVWDIPYFKEGELNLERPAFLLRNPRIDALMYVWNYSKHVQTQDAADMANNLITTLELPNRRAVVKNDFDFETQEKTLRSQLDAMEIAQVSKAARSETNKLYDTAGNIMKVVRFYETKLKDEINPAQQEKLIKSIEDEDAKLVKLNEVINLYSMGKTEPLLEKLKVQMKLWILEQKDRLIRIK